VFTLALLAANLTGEPRAVVDVVGQEGVVLVNGESEGQLAVGERPGVHLLHLVLARVEHQLDVVGASLEAQQCLASPHLQPQWKQRFNSRRKVFAIKTDVTFHTKRLRRSS